MIISRNLASLNINRIANANISAHSKSTEKVSSGYKINLAVDNPVGMAMSETMRRQIRGLMQATNNAKDGVAFVQIADGAMSEIHDMLQRMNELSLKSQNGLCTASDRAALNAEFDQLRTEIDRINNNTSFNEQPVFEEHEASYYQICGSKRWDDNQLHTISELNNELNIHLPDSYEPSDYTITVPTGVYTTQELIDEIDSTLSNMTPSNPGFVFELTSDGYCNLNFEKADGTPTKIDFVDGSLSYLLFDSFNGSASSSLLGTSEFSTESPFTIKSGENNQLEFYVESAKIHKWISITIPPGEYYRSDMIEAINKELAKNQDAAGIVAKEYEDSFIQLTGGDSVSIFGLKGNMFKVDPKDAIFKYSSVFYDNVQYGSSKGTAASVTGKAYYNSSVTDKIHLSSANNNNILRFKVNGSSEYTITFKDGAYTINEICNEINKQIKELTKDYVEVQAGYFSTSVSVPTSVGGSESYSMQYLTLSSLLKGSSSSLKFDTTKDVYVNTYNALFRDTNYLPYLNNGSTASLTGRAYLNSSFTLPENASLSFTVNGNKTCTITGIGGTYTNGDNLVSVLNSKLKADFESKIEFCYNSNGAISINAKTDDIREIEFANNDTQQNDTYRQLFVRTQTYTNSATTSSTSGTVTPIEGTSDKNTTDAHASLTIPANKTITITDDTSSISIGFTAGQSATITLNKGTYSSTQLASHIAAQINNQLKLSSNNCFKNVEVTCEDNKITLTAEPKKSNTAGYYSISFNSSTAWKAIYGTYNSVLTPTSTTASEATMNTRNALSVPITLDSSNNKLTLKIGQGTAMVEVTATIAEKTYNDIKSLAGAVQDAFIGTDLEGKITVDDKSGKLLFTSYAGSVTASGSFYGNVIITKGIKDETLKQGTYTGYDDAYIIGRKDLSTESVEIVEGANDVLTFDFTYPDSNGNGSHTMEMDIKIPEGIYTGGKIADKLQEEIQEKFKAEGFYDFNIEVLIGGEQTGVVGAIDDVALLIRLKKKDGAELPVGQYIIDGVRGSAAGFLFYKTTINPNATYIEGTKNLSKGITFKPGQNVLTLSADSVPYQYTFPANTYYTAEGFVNLLNDMFKKGDDNGKSAPLTASIENGFLKITYKALGSHSITDIGGSARSTLFLEDEGRDSRDPLLIQVGSEANQTIEIPRISVSSTSLGINSITISKQKYAEKANVRIKEAINILNSKRSTYGAFQNRLEHTVNNSENVTESVQKTESIIRDTDISSEMIRYTNLNILLQAGQRAIAESNTRIEKLLTILQ